MQLPRGNAKSTLWAAVGLWAVADLPDAPQVPLVATNMGQAMRTLLGPAKRMVRLNPELERRLIVYSGNQLRLWSAWNDGELIPLPASVDRLQGLNPSLALVDEAQTVDPEVFTAVEQGAGKRAASLVLAIGTPAPDAQGSALFTLRERALGGAKMAWVEHAAEAGCALDDRSQWARANPGLVAGFLLADQLETELTTVPEAAFRMYRLGQWTEHTEAGWLPAGSWDACPLVEAPPAGTEVVLGLAGTWASSVAVVGATLDGAVFLAWHAETATDDELDQVMAQAWETWAVHGLVVQPRARAVLVRRWQEGGLAVEVWPARVDLDVSSSTDLRRAIIEGRVAHDHHPVLAAHVNALVGSSGPDGGLRLSAPDDGRDVDAARAMRMAWWRAVELADQPAPTIW